MKVAIIIIAVLLFLVWMAAIGVTAMLRDLQERVSAMEDCFPAISQSISNLCDAVEILDERTKVLDDEHLNDLMNGKEDSMEQQ